MPSPDRIEAAAKRSPLVQGALEQARSDHAGQTRNGSGGMPYIEHPIRVAAILDEHGYGDALLREKAPQLPYLDELEDELSRLRACLEAPAPH